MIYLVVMNVWRVAFLNGPLQASASSTSDNLKPETLNPKS